MDLKGRGSITEVPEESMFSSYTLQNDLTYSRGEEMNQRSLKQQNFCV